MIDRLKNCPNCGGILNEAGRCIFCGSKIYDFLSVNFSGRGAPSERTYIRIKTDGKIVIAPIVVKNAELTVRTDDIYLDNEGGRYIQRCVPKMEIDLHLIVVGDMVQIDEGADDE